MVRTVRFLVLVNLLFLVSTLFSQQVLQNFLVLEISRGSRWSMLRIDPVEQSLVDGKFVIPKVGQTVTFPGRGQATWQQVTTNKQGWLRPGRSRAFYAFVTIDSDQQKTIILEGRGHHMVYVNGLPRVGNQYQYKDQFEAWEPKFDFSFLPVKLHKGKNTFLFKCYRGRLKVLLHPVTSPVMFNSKDVTLPDLIAGQQIDEPGGVVLLNNTDKPLNNLMITSDNPLIQKTAVPQIQPYSARKVDFYIKGQAPEQSGVLKVELQVVQQGQVLDRAELKLNIVSPLAVQRHTFISEIDGSVQYFALNPAQVMDGKPKTLVLSVHGANVEAFNQASSYFPKKWAHIVAPTNRRPYGYDWEDWGRLDALEVLNLFKSKWAIDPARIYLTGHSMGGHGTWHLGATFPDQFGAIGPSAGWISFFSYALRDTSRQQSPLEKMLLRAASASRTTALAENYKQLGIYIIHGDSDRNVPVEQSRRMVKLLKKIGHRDFIYHEEPGAGHWWDLSDEPGADCVDWPPLFDFFARHARPTKEQLRHIRFITASPGVSATNHWITIYGQERPFDFSQIDIQVDPGKRRFVGKTENISRLIIDLSALTPGESFEVTLDGQSIKQIPWPEIGKIYLEKEQDNWKLSEKWPLAEKGPHRFGGFKDAFNHRMVFVVGTNGNKEENQWAWAKARYDAEVFWYQGNGSIDIITDRQFDAQKYKNRNVILYGNANTNRAWKTLLANCPIQVQKNKIKFGKITLKGKDLAALFVFPKKDEEFTCVGVVSGTGIKGMRATNTQRYLYPGNGFPDFMIFKSSIFRNGLKAIKKMGYFNMQWQLDDQNMVGQ